MGKTNWVPFVMAMSVMVILVIDLFLIKPRWSKLTRIPLPLELVLIVISMLITYYAQLDKKYGLSIVGPVPAG